MNNNQTVENVIIIGGGPAGLAAAIYNSRASLKPLVFAGSPPGGQLTLTSEVENFPGIDSILGPELIMKMRAQAQKFSTRFLDQNVLDVDFNQQPFSVKTHDGVYKAKAVIIATGAKALWLNLESEQRLRGKGVSACATCDGFFFRNKTVAVIGGGDTALEDALTLTKFAKKVYVIHRRDAFRASKIMQQRVLNHEKIEVIWTCAVEEVLGENKVEGVKLQIGDDKDETLKEHTDLKHLSSTFYHLSLDGLFIAIGHKPDTGMFQGKIQLDKKGYVLTGSSASYEHAKHPEDNQYDPGKFNLDYQYMTSVQGVFAAGDNADHLYKQAATAAGMGVAAALEAERWLQHGDVTPANW